MHDFEGRVAVITGAASGMGRAYAGKCAAEGMKVVLADIEQDALDAAVRELRQQEGDVIGVVTNVIERANVEALARKALDTYGKVHLVFNNAGVEGYLRASEFARDRVDDLTKHLKEGDTVQAMIINVDRKNRSINLSVKAKDLSEESEAMKQLRTENAAASAGATNLGALLRAKLDKGGSEK